MKCAGGIPYGCLKVELEELPDKGHPLVMQRASCEPIPAFPRAAQSSCNSLVRRVNVESQCRARANCRIYAEVTTTSLK